MKFDNVYNVDADLDEKTFIRRTLIDLGRSNYDPKVVQSPFAPVQTCIMQVVACAAHVDTDYKFDRIDYVSQTVMQNVQKYNSSRRRYETVQEPQVQQVQRNTPVSGRQSADVTGCVFNLRNYATADNPDTWLFYMSNNIPDMADLSLSRAEGQYPALTLKDEAYYRATARCCDLVNSMAPLSDEVDNVSFDPTYRVMSVDCCMMPYYQTTYTYNKKSYAVKGYACGKPNVWAQCPDGFMMTPLDKKAEKATGVKVVQYLFPVLTWITYAAAVVLSACLGIDWFWTFLIPLVIYLVGMPAYMIAAKRYNDYSGTLTLKWAAEVKANLNAVFASMGMQPLTEDEFREIRRVDFKPMHVKDRKFRDISSYSSVTFIIFAITALIVFIAMGMILGV